MDELEKDRRVMVLTRASRIVLEMFRAGHHPTERQLNHLDGAIMGLTAQKVCGHVITEECDCCSDAQNGSSHV